MHSLASTAAENCPADETMELLLDGSLRREDLARVEAHLDTCSLCRERLAESVGSREFWNEASLHLKTIGRSVSDDATTEMDIDLGLSADFAVAHQVKDHSHLEIPLAPSDDPEMLGRLGAYEITGIIGRGGMGIVLKGWDRSLDRFIAIKILQPAFAHESVSRHRFAREAKAAAGVVHDNVIPIYSVDEHAQIPYLVMPYIKGESLQRRIDRTAPLPLEDMLEIALQISQGLEAAHQQGLVHRDIKPANILLPESVSRVVITDFGLVTAVDEASLTRSRGLLGTPSYMSPEQIHGEALDGRSDLFSLGCTLYAMSVGHPPFRAESPYAVLRKITDEPHRKLSRLRHDLPLWFSQIVDQLLEKKPKHRFASANELSVYLKECLAHIRQPETVALPAQPLRSNRRWKQWAAIGFVVGLPLIVLAALPWLDVGSRSNPAATPSLPANVFNERLELQELTLRLNRIETDLQLLRKELDDESKQ